jgi:hypothetical protein
MVRRVSAGRLRLWQAAWQEVLLMRRELLKLIPFVLVFLVLLNLPMWPTYEKGLLTGAFVVAVAWMVTWVIWVMSGLGYRLNGVMAEDATSDVCRKHARTLACLPSYKLERVDVDLLLVTRCAVYNVETKWRYRAPTDARLRGDIRRLHGDVLELRHELDGQGVPPAWIRGVLVVRGPGARALATRLVDVGGGDRIRVVSGVDLPAWLETQDRGMVEDDFARQLVSRLRLANRERERRFQAGPVLRWLARAR